MTMRECYEAIGGNYEDVLGRRHSEALIWKFTFMFLEDQSYLQLKQALKDKNYEDAFRSAHTLKGVCQNLSFDRLYEVSHELTELLRDRTGEQPGIPEAMGKVTEVNAQSFIVRPDGRVVVDHSSESWGKVYNFFGVLREHSKMSEKEIDELSEKFKEGHADVMMVNLDGRNYYLVYEKSDVQDWVFLGLVQADSRG